MTGTLIISLLAAYLMGSIPTAVWLGKYLYGVDVRERGSGNAGATNTFRVLGKRAGIPVLIIDVLKGFGAVSLAHVALDQSSKSEPFINLQIALGVSAVLGHIFPVLASFRGGKGIATLLGVLTAIHPFATLCAVGVFLAVFLLTNYVSLSSMSAACAFPFIVAFLFGKSAYPPLVFFSVLVAVLVLITHQKNIERLLKRQESKIKLVSRKRSEQSEEEELPQA